MASIEIHELVYKLKLLWMMLMHVSLLPYRHNVVFKKGADDICAFFDVKGELFVQWDNNDLLAG